MATTPHIIVRSLPAIVCDLATTNERLNRFYAGSGEPTAAEHREWDELVRRKDALESEFDTAIYAATGVSWTMLEGSRA